MSTDSITNQDGKTITEILHNMRQAWPNVAPRIRDFFVHVLGQVRILKKAYPGIMHLLIFWGVTIQVVGTAVNLMQMALFIPFVELPFPRGAGYHLYELIMDLAGVMILLGVVMAAFRRFVLRPKTLGSETAIKANKEEGVFYFNLQPCPLLHVHRRLLSLLLSSPNHLMLLSLYGSMWLSMQHLERAVARDGVALFGRQFF